MPAASRTQSEPPGKKAGESHVSDMLNSTAPAGSYDDEDDPILATLKRPALKKRNPNAKWDGRLAGMSVQEYRERKWSVDAAYAKVERRGPVWTMRKPLPDFSISKKNKGFAVGDVIKSMNSVRYQPPSYSMGMQYFVPAPEKTQGPAEYRIPSTMDPQRHPSIPKHTGPRFGTETLNPRDPTGPAPGDYDAGAIVHSSTLKSIPNFTIQGREAWKPPTAAPGPGVGEFPGLEKCMRNGKITTANYTMQGKTEPLDPPLGQRQYESPSPAHYNNPGAGGDTNAYKNKAPVWKFGGESRGLR